MFELLALCFFISFVILGIHSVTRPSKLLWFCGIRIHERDKAIALDAEMHDKLDGCFLEYEAELRRIDDVFDKNEDGSYADAEGAIKALKVAGKEYQDNISAIRNSYEMDINWLNKRAEMLEGKRLFSLLLKIAPMLTECLICMSSFWGLLILTLHYTSIFQMAFFGIPIAMPFLIFAIAGINTLAAKFLD